MVNVINYQIERGLTEADIKDILTTAIEGGIGYWAILCNDDPDWIEGSKVYRETYFERPCYCDTAYEVLIAGKAVKFEDQEDGTIYELTLEKLTKGCQLWEQETGKNLPLAIENCGYDAEDADAIIQFAIFGKVIFG